MRKETVVNRIEILEDGFVQVRRVEYLVEDDGTRTPLKNWRVAYPPVTALEEVEDAQVKQVAELIWTPEVVTRFRERADARRRPERPIDDVTPPRQALQPVKRVQARLAQKKR